MIELEIFGWIGGFLLTFCGVPMAWQSYKDGHSRGLNILFLQMWMWGEIFVLIYVLAQSTLLYPLIANCVFNTILVIVILRYKIYPRKELK